VETANPEQAAAWNGDEGKDWARNAAKYERSGARLRPYLVSSAAFGIGDRVLDIGCGTGRSTIEAARLVGSGSVIGVDLSGPMLAFASAQAAAEGATNVSFLQADAQIHAFEQASHDAAISDKGAMFFADPVAAFRNIASALRDAGRLRLLVWRELQRNHWLTAVREAIAVGRELPVPPPEASGHPFALADPDRVRSILGSAGFGDVDFVAVDEPVELGSDADDAFEFFNGSSFFESMLRDLDDDGRRQATDNLRSLFTEAATEEGVLLGSSAWLITASRRSR
jgi:SAM-dependent methyltransferase